MKRLIALLLTTLRVLALTGCGSSARDNMNTRLGQNGPLWNGG